MTAANVNIIDLDEHEPTDAQIISWRFSDNSQ